MGTYDKEYSIEWLNIDPNKEKIEARYSCKAVLDTGETVNVESFSFNGSPEVYNRMFDLGISINSVTTTLGELLYFLASCGAKLQREDFPIDPALVGKFGNLPDQLFT